MTREVKELLEREALKTLIKVVPMSVDAWQLAKCSRKLVEALEPTLDALLERR